MTNTPSDPNDETKEERVAVEVAMYPNEWEWLDTQAQRAGMTRDAFVGRLVDAGLRAARARAYAKAAGTGPNGTTSMHAYVTELRRRVRDGDGEDA